MKDNFNSVSGRENSIAGPAFQSDFVKKDKHGRTIKTEEDFKVGSFIAPDGRRIPVRNGKPMASLDGPAHGQEQKKTDLTQNEDRRSQSVKVEIARKAKNLQL
ncbi:MAG TPA: hypothetical protein VM120_20930 [Bryobacteraceae bacterium]|nr:hypothetical protein [Bryobacteraceae bacterium]